MRSISILISCVTIFACVACSSLRPKTEVVYHKPSAPVRSKVQMMPIADFDGEKSGGAADLEGLVKTGWERAVGKKNFIPPSHNLDELNRFLVKSYIGMLKSMKKPAKVAELRESPTVAEYIQKATGAAGGSMLAFTAIQGDRNTYEDGQPVILYLGLFDTKSFNWKWVTKTEYAKSMVDNWETANLNLVAASFEKATEVDRSKVSMMVAPNRKPAGAQ